MFFIQVPNKLNKILEQQLKHTRVEFNQNMKGKKLTVVAHATNYCSDLLRKERLALRNFRNQLPYKTGDDSKAEDKRCQSRIEMKTSITYYKRYYNSALEPARTPINRRVLLRVKN
jgi:hypothetical protein